MLSITVLDRTNLSSVEKRIKEAAEKGVEAAVHESVEFIKETVILQGSYIGTQYYPDVKPVTKRIKAKRGKTKVLIDTSNYLHSWDGRAKGLEGIITGGGQDYHADLWKRGWKIDKLWESVHKKQSEKIITKVIEKAI